MQRLRIMRELPFDLVTEILARVPVQDLLRFKSVCKSWRSLIQDGRFIRKHTTHAPTMILSALFPYPIRACTYQDHTLECTRVFQRADLINAMYKLIGQCEGLFCLLYYDLSLAVWNPTLRQIRIVSTIDRSLFWRGKIGFGYDHTLQDYKIVIIPPLQTQAQVLTLKSNVSRMIDFPIRTENDEWLEWSRVGGVLVGENLFWQPHTCKSDEYMNENIVSFNVVSETFTNCSSPVRRYGKLFLKAFRGSLCAYGGSPRALLVEDDMVLWRAEEDKGRIKSWSKILWLTASYIQKSVPWKVECFQIGTVINHAGLILITLEIPHEEIRLCEYSFDEHTVRKVETRMPFNMGTYHITDDLDARGIMEEYIPTLVPTS